MSKADASAKFSAASLLLALAASVIVGSTFSGFFTGSAAAGAPEGPTVTARGRGNPHVNFEDGRPLGFTRDAAQNAPLKAIGSGDVDSDGTPDLVAVDSGGSIKVYRGNPASIYPNYATSRRSDVDGSNAEGPFFRANQSSRFPIAPDEIAVGDFTADGLLDVIAFRYGDKFIYIAAGGGNGHFSHPVAYPVDGGITAFAHGEIGRSDGQTDLVIGVAGANGARLLVFEHPAGAFSHLPETVILRSPTTSVAVGNIDGDSYGDIAAASGNTLTIVRGRGHTYPWDDLRENSLPRPAPAVQSRRFAFDIRSLAVGRFGTADEQGIALLSAYGSIEFVNPPKAKPSQQRTLKETVAAEQYVPSGAAPIAYKANKTMPAPEMMFPRELLDKLKSGGLASMTKDERKALAPKIPRTPVKSKAAASAAARENFIRSIRESDLPDLSLWQHEAVFRDAKLASAAAFGSAAVRLIKVAVSDSGRDELALLDRAGRSIDLFIRAAKQPNGGSGRDQLVSLDSVGTPIALTAMRLNRDALSDLVIVNEGDAQPSYLMTAPMETYVVNTADDFGTGCPSDACSLRQAIVAAKNNPGPDLITFSIASGLKTLDLGSSMPEIGSATTIDATTQPGFSGTPLIQIEGSGLPGHADGLRIRGSNSVVRGFLINRFKAEYDLSVNGFVGGNGISIYTLVGDPRSKNNIVEGNFLGTDASGMNDLGNEITGVNLYDTDENVIGGTAPDARNLLSGSGTNNDPEIPLRKTGAGISITAGGHHQIKGNYIGTSVTGNTKVNNTFGVRLASGNNLFGGNEAGAGNVISGNGDPFTIFNPNGCIGPGILEESIGDPNTLELLTVNNEFRGNRIGTNAAGTAALSNCSTGHITKPQHMSLIGSIAAGGRNIISGNMENALYCAPFGRGAGFAEYTLPDGGFCSILGNNIGTDISGSYAIPNDDVNTYSPFLFYFGNLVVWNSTSLSALGGPGGTSPSECTGHCNLISGNEGGVAVYVDASAGEVGIYKNFVGTNRFGNAALGNDSGIISLSHGTVHLGAPERGNVISGNRQQAMWIEEWTSPSLLAKKIQGNLIGTDASGTTAIPNGTGSDAPELGSILVRNENILIGGTGPEETNIISGNATSGIFVSDDGRKTTIAGNKIGVNAEGQPLGNALDGVFVMAKGTTIGGSAAASNVIAHNTRTGILLIKWSSTLLSELRRNSIRFNSIHDNGALGIDLSNRPNWVWEPDGVTANDCDDIDTGANDLQNYPELFTPVQNTNGTLRIDTILRSRPSRPFTIDYYLNTQADTTNHGEGETHIGSINVLTNGNGFVSAAFNTPMALPETAVITATATDEEGNTSEFSCAAGVCHQARHFADAVRQAELGLQCVEPIVVNTEGNEPDIDEDAPISQRDGLCDVDPDTEGEQCTLRAAIQEANARPDYDIINFDIPGGGVRTITVPLGGPLLPDIKEKVDINAVSQPGWSGSPMVQLVGEVSGNTAPVRGLTVASSNVTIRGLAVSRFTGNIVIANDSGAANNNKIENCYIGLNADGSFDPGVSSAIGISILGSPANAQNNQIGNAYNGNVIGNNITGILIGGAGARNNAIVGNKIGVGPSGTAPAPNGDGIIIGSSARGNTVGAELDSGSNIISGNAIHGIVISSNGNQNTVTGNYIGTAANGLDRIANGGFGVYLTGGADQNIIGGTGPLRNIISGNNGNDSEATPSEVYIDENTSSNFIRGNYIGLKKNGTEDFGVRFGVIILGSNNIIGGNSNTGNDFGSRDAAVMIFGHQSPASGNRVSHNRIGTYGNGSSAGNGRIGVLVRGSANDSRIENNLISGNEVAGIALWNGPTGSLISSNRIGTNSSGSAAIPNGFGVLISRSISNTVSANLISANTISNVYIGEDVLQDLSGFAETSAFLDRRFPAPPSREGIQYTSYNIIRNNRIGTNAAGTQALSNGGTGIHIGEKARENLIGGSRNSNQGNIISGHTNPGNGPYGIYIGSIFVDPSDDRLPRENVIQGNTIGLGTNGAVIGNGIGIKVNAGVNNLLGAPPDCLPKNFCNPSDLANIIGGSINEAILVRSQGSSETKISGNMVGVKQDGSPAANGGDGIKLSSVGETDVVGNTVGNSGGNGINIEDPEKVMPRRRELLALNIRVIANNVGVLPRLNLPANIIANQMNGILVNGVSGVLVGSLDPLFSKNIVSGNLGHGIKISGADAQDNIINHTIVGTDGNAALNIGNGGDGIRLEAASENLIGDPGGDPDKALTVGGNSHDGIALVNSATNVIQAASIGVKRTESSTLSVPNGSNGIRIENGAGNRVGNSLFSFTNIIGRNQKNGILIKGVGSVLNRVINNKIGGSGLGNSIHGIHVTLGASNNIIGGDEPNQGNQIFENGGNGILIDENDEGGLRSEGVPPPTGNRIERNDISGNALLGIDIGPPGRTPNDAGDPDEGPNRGQNHPALRNLRIDPSNRVRVEMRVDSHPDNQNYGTGGIRVDLFKSDLLGQGSVYLTSFLWTQSDFFSNDYVDHDLGDAGTLGITSADRVTAVAIDADGNSSEFFPVSFGPTSAGVSVSGRVLTAAGAPLRGTTVTITDDNGVVRTAVSSSLGYYAFEGVQAGRTYVVTAVSRRYRFTPRIVNVADPISELDLIALE
jgi:CSLREA domain-containing protein